MRWIRVLLALMIIASTGWLIGRDVYGVRNNTGGQSHPFLFQNAPWIESNTGGGRAYMRATFELSSIPDRATLWLEADQQFVVYVNGAGTVASNTAAVRKHKPSEVVPVDIVNRLRQGTNVIGVMATNYNGHPARIRALLDLTSGEIHATALSTASGWRATSDVALVKHPLRLRSPRFGEVTFDDALWPPAKLASKVPPTAPSAIPKNVLETALSGSAIGATNLEADSSFEGNVRSPAGTTQSWVSIAASGSYTLSIDGHEVAYRTQSIAPGTLPNKGATLFVYDVGSLLDSKSHLVQLHVSASGQPAAAYVQIANKTPAGISISTSDDHWQSVASGTTSDSVALGSPSTVFGHMSTQLETITGEALPGSQRLLLPALGVLALFLLVGIGSSYLSRRTNFMPITTITTAAAACLPVWFSAVGFDELRRIGALPDGPVEGWIPIVLVVMLCCTFAIALRLVLRNQQKTSLVPKHQAAATAPTHSETPYKNLIISHRIAPTAWDITHRLLTSQRSWVVAITVICTAAMGYDIGFQPMWQDELTSLLVARSMRGHFGIPKLPSTLLYFKAELYHLLIAGIGLLVNDNTSDLRLVSVGWYAATILVFGLAFMPILLPKRPVAQVAITALFATAPQAMTWARQLRMYQQEQFFAVAFLAAFAAALKHDKTRDIILTCVLMVLMYFSHEESFVLLPAVGVAFLVFRKFRWTQNWKWWIYGGSALALIFVQYEISKTHPPIFGYDLSNEPYVKWDVSEFWYYYANVLFGPSTSMSLAAISTLSIFGTIAGIKNKDFSRRYLSLILWVSFFALSCIFSARDPRYTFVILPVLFALGGIGALDLMDWITQRLSGPGNQFAVKKLVTSSYIPGFVLLAAALPAAVSDYGLAVTRLTGKTVTYAYTNYAPVVNVLKHDIRPGDLFVTLAPPVVPAYYLGRAPDMIIATGRDKLLYLIEHDGQATDTIWGAPVILTADDLQHVMEQHHRVWVVTDQGQYLSSVPQEISIMIKDDFQEVAESNSAALYLWQS